MAFGCSLVDCGIQRSGFAFSSFQKNMNPGTRSPALFGCQISAFVCWNWGYWCWTPSSDTDNIILTICYSVTDPGVIALLESAINMERNGWLELPIDDVSEMRSRWLKEHPLSPF
jgi:hypothetical protein